MSSFLKKAKAGLQDVKDIKAGLEKMGINQASVKAKYNDINSKGGPSSTGKETAAPSAASVPASTEKEVAPPVDASISPSTVTDASYAGTPTTTNATPSVVASSAPDAPTKLSLAARKSIRDEMESKREDLEGRISKALGTPWKVFYDALGVLSYAAGHDFPLQNPGIMFFQYFQYATEGIERFAKEFGADGVAEFNSLAPSHTITLEPTSDKNVMYSSCIFLHDALVLIFRDDQLGTGASRVCETLVSKVNAAASAKSINSSSGAHALNLVARNSIAKDWEPNAGELLEKARNYLKAPTLTFVPNFEANYAHIRAWEANDNESDDPQWDSKIGAATLEYFNGLVGWLVDKRFHKDELLQEGFKEAVDRNEVVLRVVDKLNDLATKSYHRRYHDCVVEGGTFYIETLPGSWWSNARNATENVVERL